MKILLATLLLTVSAFAQQPGTPEGDRMEKLAETVCKAPWAGASPERARMADVVTRLRPILKQQYPNENIAYLAVRSNVVNAFTHFAPGQPSYICMPTAIIDLMSNDGEIAFVVGHETGHAVDEGCKNAERNRNSLALSRECETRADTLGFRFLVAMGYNPYDAGGSFGKLAMYSGENSIGVGAQMRALSQDHPMTPQRIANMHRLLAQYRASAR